MTKPTAAAALIERAITAHGGVKAWQDIKSICLPFRQGSGLLLRAKGFGRTFSAPSEFEIFPHERTTIFHDYPVAGQRGRFVNGDVVIEPVDGGSPLEQSLDHRRTFCGFAKYRRWTSIDALYFFGYALWHYHMLPFTLADAHSVRVLRRDGQACGVDVTFPPDIPTHCRRQQIYFGDDGRIVRHDYVADIVGSWASGAHLWEDYARVGGILIARHRRVLWRIGRQALPIPVLDVQLGEAVVGS